VLHPVSEYVAPDGVTYLELPADNLIIRVASAFAKRHSLDKSMPNCSVIVRDGRILGIGANGSLFHEQNKPNLEPEFNGCPRRKMGCKTGTGYEHCDGCHPRNHGEARATADMLKRGNVGDGAVNVMFGHYWACPDCRNTLAEQGVTTVYVLEGSLHLFDIKHANNAVGRQFELCPNPLTDEELERHLARLTA
jgi:deoxycytidylate deaminase